MNTRIPSCLLAALLAASVSAQEEHKAPSTKKDATQEAAPVPIKDLILRLGDGDYQVRRKAEADLRARGKDALSELKQAAEGNSDEEIRWRARRIVRQVEEGGESGTLRKRVERPIPDQELTPPRPQLRTWSFPQAGGQDLDDVFNQMFERMEKQFGIDIPRQRFFHDEFFKDLERQMDDASRHGGSAQGQSMQMNIGPDGVKVRVEEKGADGKTETKSYEAPDMDTFRSKYPDIAKRYFDGNNGFRMQLGVPRFRLWPGNPMTPVEPVEPELMDQQLDESQFQAIPAGERLGVTIEPIDEALRGDLGLEDGQGMRVQGVLPGSLADRLGIKKGDILTKVAGKAVHETGDVRDALRGVAGGGKVSAEVHRKGKPVTLEAEKAGEAAKGDADAKKELKKKKKPEIR